MINTFLGTALAIITVFGLVLPTWHWLSMGWKESEQKGTNPYIGGLFGLFVGYMIGFAIVGSFMILVGLLGFEGQIINCYNFTGAVSSKNKNENKKKTDWEKVCQEKYSDAWRRAYENKTLPSEFEKYEKDRLDIGGNKEDKK